MFFILVALAAFGKSNLMACGCASKKKKASAGSQCCKVQEDSAKQCCNKSEKKPVKKACCKMICCTPERKQKPIIENNRNTTALTLNATMCFVNSQDFTISFKPVRKAMLDGPDAAKLCVFLY